uniref:C2H2-type domain-containing protein n=1 Tax=Spongospora subterranea TaxID=70186 RepID=A0A0H5R4W3_9EUKA|eukprot:CRZ09193.1 hypothetical protein [Spongospora subterranea]
MYECQKCSKRFSNPRDRKNHLRKKHQELVTVTMPDRTRLIVHRSIRNDIHGFSCPVQCCDTFLEHPQSFRRHVLPCFRLGSVNHIPIPDHDQDQEDPTSLTLYGISFIAELSILVCRECQYVLNPNSRSIRQHIRDKHTGATPSLAFVKQALLLIEDEICSANHPSLNQYMKPSCQLLPPVPGIKIISGYRCLLCAYYCPQSETMRRHFREHHVGSLFHKDSYRPCQLQALFPTHSRKYFGILPTNLKNLRPSSSTKIEGHLDKAVLHSTVLYSYGR